MVAEAKQHESHRNKPKMFSLHSKFLEEQTSRVIVSAALDLPCRNSLKKKLSLCVSMPFSSRDLNRNIFSGFKIHCVYCHTDYTSMIVWENLCRKNNKVLNYSTVIIEEDKYTE